MSNKSRSLCASGQCGCQTGMNRRGFIRAAGLGAAAVATGLPVMAGPFEESDFEKLIPADKKLDPKWVRSLFERGKPTVYRGRDLATIGMPVGGICAGHLYLGGDGKLWLWDIFNQFYHGVGGRGRNGQNYVEPMKPASPLEQGFAVRVKAKGKTWVRSLDSDGFPDIRFRGEYPIGRVEYRDAAIPITVSLEAFSPFIPLDVEHSSYPATVMEYTIRNTGKENVEVEVAGWMENAICLHHGSSDHCLLRNRLVVPEEPFVAMEYSAVEPLKPEKEAGKRPDVLFEDFEKAAYQGWTATGSAFGNGPIEKAKMPRYQGDVGSRGKRLVNTHNTRQGEDVRKGDAHTGTLTSGPFTIERRCVNFLIGGGSHKGKTCINLLVEDKIIRTATGRDDNRMQPHSWDVGDLEGKTARLQIVDDWTGGWGNIGIDHIVFSDTPQVPQVPLKELSDFGTMCLAAESGPGNQYRVAIPNPTSAEHVFQGLDKEDFASRTEAPFDKKPVGALSRHATLEPGQETVARFLLTWHFPNLRLRNFREPVGRYYAKRFDSARAVAEHIVANFDALAAQTRLWRDTWYDSTLPYWFLDRTFANTSTLATSTCFRFANGRFYGWEGIGCCPGTCMHVWHYAQAVARVFPELERITRERVDLGIAFNEQTGVMAYRGEVHKNPAHDGQAGTILRFYREHQISPDDAFLRRNWPKIKKAVEFLIARDANGDGIIEGAQPNTLDAAWYGKIAWLTSLYLAALRAAEAMADEMEDGAFAQKVRAIRDRGGEEILKLWNGEYFIQQPDPEHMDAIGADSGCYIDQVFGQSWAFQVGLGRLYGEEHIKGALRSLWKYNFAPDVGPYKEVYKRGRPYALAGDAGLIMCTWPKGGRRKDWEKHWQFGYFNECMTGFEYEVSGHMIWEGMLKEGMAVARAIHDRYHASLRNPYNEIECSDHYARAMASYGVYLAACGYEYHGPKGYIAFAPRLTPEDFRAAFTAAQGWGTYTQKRDTAGQRSAIQVKWGRLRLRTLAFAVAEGKQAESVQVTVNGKPVDASHARKDDRVTIQLPAVVDIEAGQTIEVAIQG